MSSGRGGVAVRSSSDVRTQRRSAAASTSSSSVSGKMRPLGTRPSEWPARPTRCRRVAIERVAPTWTTRSTSPMSMPSSSDAVATSARSDPALSRRSASSRRSFDEAAVVAGDGLLAQDLRELRGDALGHLARVHEHECRAVLAHQLGQAAVDLLPLLVGADGRERRRRHLDREVERPEAAGVHEPARCGRRPPGRPRPPRAASGWPRARAAGSAAP